MLTFRRILQHQQRRLQWLACYREKAYGMCGFQDPPKIGDFYGGGVVQHLKQAMSELLFK